MESDDDMHDANDLAAEEEDDYYSGGEEEVDDYNYSYDQAQDEDEEDTEDFEFMANESDDVLISRIQVVAAEKTSKGGCHDKLTMKVVVSLLWGVPSASEALHLVVQSSGGIVDKVYWQWDFL